MQNERDFQSAKFVLDGFESINIGGHDVAEQAARNYRYLRARGHTVRKLIDVLIATRCIIEGYQVLHHDRDFLPFAEHLGLQVVPVPAVP